MTDKPIKIVIHVEDIRQGDDISVKVTIAEGPDAESWSSGMNSASGSKEFSPAILLASHMFNYADHIINTWNQQLDEAVDE